MSLGQLSRGLTRVAENLADLALDEPRARQEFDAVLALCRWGCTAHTQYTTGV